MFQTCFISKPIIVICLHFLRYFRLYLTAYSVRCGFVLANLTSGKMCNFWLQNCVHLISDLMSITFKSFCQKRFNLLREYFFCEFATHYNVRHMFDITQDDAKCNKVFLVLGWECVVMQHENFSCNMSYVVFGIIGVWV